MKQFLSPYVAVLLMMALPGSRPAHAQFVDLATDSRGSRLLFSTSLSLPNEERNDQPKIVELSAGRVLRTLFSARVEMQSPGDAFPSSFPVLRGPMLSSDGSVTAFTATRWCLGGSRCLSVELVLGTVTPSGCGAGHACAFSSAGTASLSANGRWAVFYNPASMLRRYGVLRLNLQSGAAEPFASPLPGPAPAGARTVANDGTIVSGSPDPYIEVRRPGSDPIRVPVQIGLDSVVVSDDARFAVGVTRDLARSLVAVELQSGLETVIVEAEEGCAHPVLSDGGSRLLFLSAANWEARNDGLAVQAWTIDIVTGRLRQWTSEPSGIVDATLSGDGQTLWAATSDGRIVRIQDAGEEAEEMVPASPAATLRRTARIAPGSRYTLNGRGLAGARVEWKALALPVIWSSNERLEFLLPFGAALGLDALEVKREGSPFAPLRIAAEAIEAAPLFAETERYAQGLREDGSPLTRENPAAPGEIVTLTVTGLGPVSASGQVLLPVELREIEDASVPPPLLPVLNASRDPESEGMYLIRFRVPPAISANPLQLGIRVAGADHDEDWVWLPVALP